MLLYAFLDVVFYSWRLCRRSDCCDMEIAPCATRIYGPHPDHSSNSQKGSVGGPTNVGGKHSEILSRHYTDGESMWGVIAAITGASIALALVHQTVETVREYNENKREPSRSLPPPDPNAKKNPCTYASSHAWASDRTVQNIARHGRSVLFTTGQILPHLWIPTVPMPRSGRVAGPSVGVEIRC